MVGDHGEEVPAHGASLRELVVQGNAPAPVTIRPHSFGVHHDDRRGPRQVAEDDAHRPCSAARVRGRRARSNGGEDLGPTPHDVYDSALGACKALTTLWYARRKLIPVEDIRVTVERDDSEERRGVYRLRVTLDVTGALTDAQRQELLTVAGKCPVHKLMTQVTTEVVTELAPVGS